MEPTPERDRVEAWPSELELAAIFHGDQPTTLNFPQAESLSLTSVWQLASPAAAEAGMRGRTENYVYRRVDHPNAHGLAQRLARLHRATHAIVTAQGMSAVAAVAQLGLQPGAHVWLGHELYGETTQLLTKHLARWQVQVRAFDPCDPVEIDRLSAAAGVSLVFVETITNPRLRVCDIAAVARATHRAGGRLVVDNTFATYQLCRPLEFGADIVVESLGKQVNGHSDAMLGLIASCDEQLMAQLAEVVKTFGWASSPLDCYLTARGLPTLALRLERACTTALALAERLSAMSQVRGVDYPGLADHPQAAIARRQLQAGCGWMLSFKIDPSPARVERLFAALRPAIQFVPSLGDVCTTISHPFTTSHRDSSPDQLARLGIDHGTIRVSCGLEPTPWLIERFSAAIHAACND